MAPGASCDTQVTNSNDRLQSDDEAGGDGGGGGGGGGNQENLLPPTRSPPPASQGSSVNVMAALRQGFKRG